MQKNVVITEHQLHLLESFVSIPGQTERIKEVNAEKEELENFIESNGEYMTDITNGKTYLVQYLKALSDLVGEEYAMCAPVRNDGTYGAFYVKPFKTFIKKQGISLHKDTVPMPVKKNMYQHLGYNK